MYRRNHYSGGPMCGRRRKKRDPQEPADHALGRSRGGFSTKIHILCDGLGHPLHFHITPGQTHESTVLDTMFEGLDAELLNGEGQRVTWPDALSGDYHGTAVRPGGWIRRPSPRAGIRPCL